MRFDPVQLAREAAEGVPMAQFRFAALNLYGEDYAQMFDNFEDYPPFRVNAPVGVRMMCAAAAQRLPQAVAHLGAMLIEPRIHFDHAALNRAEQRTCFEKGAVLLEVARRLRDEDGTTESQCLRQKLVRVRSADLDMVDTLRKTKLKELWSMAEIPAPMQERLEQVGPQFVFV